jgi:hypothetical protein
MAVAGSRLQVEVKDVSVSASIPNNPTAKLMYYFNCVCYCIEPDDNYAVRRFRNCSNYHDLTRQEKIQLLDLCITLSPSKLDGMIFHREESMNGSNRFLKLSATKTGIIATESLLIGGQSKKIVNIMQYKNSWMENNYYTPVRELRHNLSASTRSSNDDCNIL